MPNIVLVGCRMRLKIEVELGIRNIFRARCWVKIKYHSETGTCSECGLQDRKGYMPDSHKRVAYRIENTQRNICILALIRTGFFLRECDISSSVSKPFMYSNCSVTLSHFSLHSGFANINSGSITVNP